MEQKTTIGLLQSANKEADRLTLLIRDLLDMSRIDSGKLKLDKRSCQVSEYSDSVSGVLSDNCSQTQNEIGTGS